MATQKVRDIVIKFTVVDADSPHGVDPTSLVERIEGGIEDNWFLGHDIIDPGHPRDPTPAEEDQLNTGLSGQSQCQNCEMRYEDSELNEIQDIFQRVDPGEPMPSGECPNCGALCQPVKNSEK